MKEEAAKALAAEGEALRRALRKRIRKMHTIPCCQLQQKMVEAVYAAFKEKP